MTENGVFSDNMVITWRVSQPVHTVLLYSDTRCPSDDSSDCEGKTMDYYYANLIVFPEPVIMSIPAARLDTEYTPTERKITVQGTVTDILNSIYEAYQTPYSDAQRTSTEKEIQLANNGSKGPRLIDQMSDLVFFEGWKYDEDTKKASLFLGS